MLTKAKVTITLDSKLLAAVDAQVGNRQDAAHGQRSRSAVIEDALRQWKRQPRQKVPTTSKPAKARAAMSLDAKLLAAVDSAARNGQRSRSAVIEDIVRQWKRQRDQEQEDREIEEYYRTMSDEEREEDRRWVEGVGRGLAEIWGPDPGWREEWQRFRAEAKSTGSNSRKKTTRGRPSSSR